MCKQSIQARRFIRRLAVVLALGLVGVVLGCSGQPNSPAVDKAEGKKIAAETKAARREMKSERAQQSKGGPLGKGRGPG
jgi:hypothetical protein